MKKKKSGGGGANWMDTYGDMVTLLLCFFVLLYSMSTISEEKWRAIITSFNPFAQTTPTDPEGNGGPNADPIIGEDGVNMPEDQKIAQKEIDETIDELYAMMVQYAQSDGLEGALSLEKDGGKIYVKFNQNVFFAPDEPYLLEGGQEILKNLCGLLDTASNAIEEIHIEGHTARYYYDKPNEVKGDWELAGDRAMNVQYFLYENSSIHPARIVADVYGQWRPEGDNRSEEGRAVNRRVVMIISGRDIEEELKGNSVQNYVTMTSEGS